MTEWLINVEQMAGLPLWSIGQSSWIQIQMSGSIPGAALKTK
jgi:hypothetical protein